MDPAGEDYNPQFDAFEQIQVIFCCEELKQNDRKAHKGINPPYKLKHSGADVEFNAHSC